MLTPFSADEVVFGEPDELCAFDEQQSVENTTVGADEVTQIRAANVLKGAVLSCCAFCAFLGNLLVIVSVVSTKRLQTITNLFVVSLAVADMAVSILVLPLSILLEVTERWIFNHLVCDIWISSDVMLCTASILNLCAISVDRYLAITRPLRYAARRSKKTATLMILCAWFLSFVITMPPILGWRESDRGEHEGVCQLTKNPGYIVFSALGSFFIPATVMVTIYIRIFYVANRRKKTFVTAFRSHRSALKQLTTGISSSETAPSLRNGDSAPFPVYGEAAKTTRIHRNRSQNGDQRVPNEFSIDSHRVSDCQIELDELTSHENDNENDNEQDASDVSDVLKKLRITPSIVYVVTGPTTKLVRERRVEAADHYTQLDSPLAANKSLNEPRDSPGSPQKLVSFTQQSQSLLRPARKSSNLTQITQISVSNDSSSVGEPHSTSNGQHQKLIDMVCSPSADASEFCSFSSVATRGSLPISASQFTCRSMLAAGRNSMDETNSPSRSMTLDSRRFSELPMSRSLQSKSLLKSDAKGSNGNRIDRSISARLRVRQEMFAMRQRRKEKAILRTENKTAQTLAVVMGCFVISWSPFFFMYLIKPFCNCHVPESVEAAMTWLGYCNSLCNPFIYAFYNKDFLNAFVRIIRQILCVSAKRTERTCTRSRKSNASINSHSD